MNPDAACLHELLEACAARSPEATAVEDSFSQSLTYRQLNEAASRVADRLASAGVKRGDRVGLCMPKSINSVISLFGAMKVGAAYVPVDYSAPPERNRFIFTNCRARVVCADEPRTAALKSDAGFAITVLTFPGESTSGVGAPWMDDGRADWKAADGAVADDLSYILYTSGSTGLPKGVIHTHASAISFVRWVEQVQKPSAADRFSSHAPFHFDLSVLDLYVPMTVGAAIVLVGDALGKEPQALAQYIADKRLTVWYSVPSILAMLAQHGRLEQHDYSSLHTVYFAGEVFPVKHLALLKHKWPRPRFGNLYGPTETNVCTYYWIPDTIPPDRTSPFPIGKVCENCEGLVLDGDFKPVRDGAEGVLYIRQSGPVMKEYWELPEQSAKCFWTDARGVRWYCTGDVVVKDAAGDYLFIGRRDRMVKRRGYRIELGEIEAALYKHPQVREAAAIASETPEGVIITAYLSSKDGAKLSIIAMKQYCAANLLSYMNPDRFVTLDDLPRTSTGKVDYQSLRQRGATP